MGCIDEFICKCITNFFIISESWDPRITNEFASAAFRFGHSLIPSRFNVISKSSKGFSLKSADLKALFFKPKMIEDSPCKLKPILRFLHKKLSNILISAIMNDLVRGLTSQDGEE